jgi:pyruvate dehydrogenase E1 component alpha subunit
LKYSQAYGISGYTLDGMDYFACYEGFDKAYKEVMSTSRPVLIECICERFRGHSISDPALYRSKEEVQILLKRDPISSLKNALIEAGQLTEEKFKEIDQETREKVVSAMKYAESCPWPSLNTLEEDVYAP